MNFRFFLLTGAAAIMVFAAILIMPGNSAPSAAGPAATGFAPATDGVYYADCAAVHAANIPSLRADQPGYRPALDGNMNGVACEPVGGAADAVPSPDLNPPAPTSDAEPGVAQSSPTQSAAPQAAPPPENGDDPPHDMRPIQ